MTAALRPFARDLCAVWGRVGEDVEPFMAFFTEDVRVELMVHDGLMKGMAGPFDKAGWRAQAIAEAAVSKLDLIVDHVGGGDDFLAIEATGNLSIAGHPYRNRYCFVAELAGGKVRRFRIYLDTLYAMQAVQWLRDAARPVPGA